MDFSNIGLFSALREKMRYSSERQSVLAKNIANANVPGYKAQDVKPVDFSQMVNESSGKLQMAATQAGHISGAGKGGKFKIYEDGKSFETTPVGNNVVLEEQTFKMAQNSTDYQTATSIYRKMVELFKIAAGGNR